MTIRIPKPKLLIVDYDECDLGISDCEHLCINYQGRYSCECYHGYRLNDDRRTCTKGIISEDIITFTGLNAKQL